MPQPELTLKLTVTPSDDFRWLNVSIENSATDFSASLSIPNDTLEPRLGEHLSNHLRILCNQLTAQRKLYRATNKQ